MKTLLALIKKEFIQIRRNRIMKFIIIGMPIVQLVILSNAANFDIHNLSVTVIDRDGSSLSAKLSAKLQSSGYFVINKYTKSSEDALADFVNEKADVILEIPSRFESDVYRAQSPQLSVTVNAINSMKAGIASTYINAIVNDFASEQVVEMGIVTPTSKITVEPLQWFNPKLDYKSLMLPGILAILITLIGILLSSLNIVREKEAGTIEQLNVTPIKKTEFIIGKLFPIWVIGLFQLTFGLLISVFVFDLHIVGSLWLLYLVVAVYLFAVLGFGFLISISAQTQIQAMLITLFFAIIFILLRGLFTPTEYMHAWAKALNTFNPTAYLVEIIRLVVLKGSTLSEIVRPFCSIIAFGVGVNTLVVLNYRKAV